MALSADELAQIRDDLEDTLYETCVIQRAAIASDGQGGQAETWAAAGTVLCRRGPLIRRSDESVSGGRTLADNDWTITLPALTDVTEKDRLLIDGTTYQIRAVFGARSNELYRRVTASRST